MSEDKNLLAKISQLSSQINLHKTHTSLGNSDSIRPTVPNDSSHHLLPRGAGSWKTPRLTPYGRYRGRGGRMGSTHRNRVLILNPEVDNAENADMGPQSLSSQTLGSSTSNGSAGVNSTNGSSTWVSKRDRHMQLINTSVYDKETQMRKKAISETLRQKTLQEGQREKAKIANHLRSVNKHAGRPNTIPSATGLANYEISINGLRFRVLNGGSKLSRILDVNSSAHSTPKQANVGGVMFYRSKNGNLYRSGLVKAKKKSVSVKKIDRPCKHFTTTGNPSHSEHGSYRRKSSQAWFVRVESLTDIAVGRCLKGPLCPFVHDPNAVAVCLEYLQKGTCATGESCDLSHDPTPERVPACVHYLRGHCSNSACRYAHVRVNPSALVCRDFATLGYCGKGARCAERHTRECPEYANTGVCGKQLCHLPHVDRAGQIRKHAANATGNTARDRPTTSSNDESDLSSDEGDYDEIDSDDVDSDGLDDEDMMDTSENDTEAHILSRQQDFVRFRDI